MASIVATAMPSRNGSVTPLRNATRQIGSPLCDSSRPTESPGNWQHPRLREIKTRQARLVFDASNVKVVVFNGAAVLLLLGLRSFVVANGPPFR